MIQTSPFEASLVNTGATQHDMTDLPLVAAGRRGAIDRALLSHNRALWGGADFDFTLPPELEAHAPPEARGLARDEVRLMVSRIADDSITHARFRDFPSFLAPGDVLVINTSGTLNAALPARLDDAEIALHLSTHLPGDLWSAEVRAVAHKTTQPLRAALAGRRLALPEGGEAQILVPYPGGDDAPPDGISRLWVVALHLPLPWRDYLAQFGAPIHYSYVPETWPNAYYQTVYATERGSAEMPSAGRAFTPEIITRLVAEGIGVVPLLLHTGVASLEDHEPPYAEWFRVPEATARAVNAARATGGRVVAVGTTVVRALESVADARGHVHAGEGWTDLVITPARGMHAVSAMLTGLHEPRASHLAMLAALAPTAHLRHTYAAALSEGYLWHEFGDLHLILP
jgi:S-adenosylmethionine:tRNA ribosyltransferase-isomerase